MWAMLLALFAGFAAPMPPVEPEPSVADLARFPDVKTVEFWLDFSRRYQEHCEHEASGSGWAFQRDWWMAAAIEAERMRGPWEYLHTAQLHDAIGGRAEWAASYLGAVRGEIGPARYWAGQMPPPVPWHRWREVESNPNAR